MQRNALNMMKHVHSLQRADFVHLLVDKAVEILEISSEAETHKISLPIYLVAAAVAVHAKDKIFKLKQPFLSGNLSLVQPLNFA
jgi:hypothetical protein